MYKYLGLVLTEHLDYQLMPKVVTQSANRPLGVLVAKSKVTGGMPYDVFVQLHKCICPTTIWGTGNCFCIKSVLYKECHFMLGVGKYTPNTALE